MDTTAPLTLRPISGGCDPPDGHDDHPDFGGKQTGGPEPTDHPDFGGFGVGTGGTDHPDFGGGQPGGTGLGPEATDHPDFGSGPPAVSDSQDPPDLDAIMAGPGRTPQGSFPVDRDRASVAGATKDPRLSAIGGTGVPLETGLTSPGKLIAGGAMIAAGALVPGAQGLLTPGANLTRDAFGPKPSSASVAGGNTGIPREGGLLDSSVDPNPEIGLRGEHDGVPVLTAADVGDGSGDGEGGDGSGAGGFGGGGSGGSGGGGTELPDFPDMPEPPEIPLPAPPPAFPNPNNVNDGGPAMDETRRIIEDARRYGRQSTLLSGGGEGLSDLGPIGTPTLSGAGTPTRTLAESPPGAASREGTRDPGNRFENTVIREMDALEARNVQQGAPTVPTTPLEEPGEEGGRGLPDGWSLVKTYTTIPYSVVTDPDGKRWIRDNRTGELTEDMLTRLPTEPSDSLPRAAR